jgi:hypothetical protein
MITWAFSGYVRGLEAVMGRTAENFDEQNNHWCSIKADLEQPSLMNYGLTFDPAWDVHA